MTRVDLLQISEEDLVAATNRLTLRRAEKDLAEGLEVAIEESAAELVFRWADEVTCRFPEAGGLHVSRCSCPARRFCVHRVRSVLAYRAQATEDVAAPEWSPADYPLEVLERATGYERALRMLHEGIEAERDGTAVSLPELGLRVRFLAGRGLDEALCSCREPDCLHVVLAALSCRPRLPSLEDAPLAPERMAHVTEIAAALADSGLDGLAVEEADRLDVTRLEVIGDGLPGVASDLRELAELLRAYHERSAQFDGQRWLWALSRLQLRAAGLPESRGAARRALLGDKRRDRLPAKHLSLVGLGAEGFVGPGGAVVHLHLADRPTSRVLRVTVGRSSRTPLAGLYRRVELWEGHSVATLAPSAFSLREPRLATDGSLSAGGQARVFSLGPAPALDDVVPQLLVRSPQELADRWRTRLPPLLRPPADVDMLVLLELDRRAPPAPRFDEISQTLDCELSLAGGGAVDVAIPHRADTRALVAALERWPANADRVLARVAPGPGRFRARPITLWVGGQPYQLAFGETPESGRPETRVPVAGPSKKPPLGSTAAEVTLEGLVDDLEGWVVSGLGRPASWRRARLRQRAEELRGLGLEAGQRRVERVLDDDGLRIAPVAELTLWATTLLEALAMEHWVE